MLEEAAPLTEPPQGGWLGEWLLSVLGTFTRSDRSRGDYFRGVPQRRVLGF